MASPANKITKTTSAPITSRLFCCSTLNNPTDAVVVWIVFDWVCDGLMARSTFATLLMPPPDPVMVNMNEPVGELLGMVTVSVETKSGVPDGRLKTPSAPDGYPETANETCELKPFKPAT